MRFLELELVAFGPFTGRKLDLSRPGPTFDLVYGPNEAGKTTTLRAALGLLYGIEDRTGDDYVHERANLRIAARLRAQDGTELSLCRRKGKKDTLLDAEGRPLDEALLQRMLCGIPEPLFRSMFGLDHARLRDGGEQLRLGRGDLGESLFQAGAGAADIHRLLSRLNSEADAIFLLWCGQRRLNDAIKRHEEARKQVREHSKRAEGFRIQEQQLERARQESGELQRKRHALLGEQSRCERALRVLPGLARRRELLAKIAALGAVAALPEDAADARRAAQAELAKSEAQASQLEQTLTRLRQRRQSLLIPESLSALNPAVVSRIAKRLGSQQKAAEDLPRVRGELRTLERTATAELRALGSEIPLDQVEALRIDSATQTRLAKLAREHSGLHANLAAAERDLAAAEAQLEQAAAALAACALVSTGKGSPLEHVLPSEATLADFRQRFERVEHARERHQEADARLAERDERVLFELGTLQHEGVPPTEQELTQARGERDQTWQRLRVALLSGRELPAGLADSYEREQKRSDELADRLRREASRVSRLAALLSEQASIARERQRLSQQRGEHEAEQTKLGQQWRALWAKAGLEPRSPAEMQSLLAKVTNLLEAGRRGRAEAEQRLLSAQQARERWQAQWSELTARLGLAPDASAEETREVLEARRLLLERAAAMGSLRGRVEGMERDSHELEAEVARLLQQHAPELAALPFEQAAEALVERHGKARRDLAERDHIDEEMRDASARLEQLELVGARARAQLEERMRAAGVADLDQLDHAERRSADARTLRLALREVEDELLDHGEGVGLDALVTETMELAPEHVRVRLFELREELEALNEEHTNTVRTVGSLESGLELLRSDDQSAEAAAEAEQHLSRIKHEARGYLRKKLAAELLRQEIARYRERNQGPIVGQASELFARLTLGRYPKLRVDYNDEDELVLKCLDEHAHAVDVEMLSDGARDQLYLALRLASLRLFAERSEPMPLLLDDVLIHFDDERARVALELLSEFATVTQILFFTHHARIVELARQAMPSDRLVEHRLGEPNRAALSAV